MPNTASVKVAANFRSWHFAEVVVRGTTTALHRETDVSEAIWSADDYLADATGVRSGMPLRRLN
jgi:hypothetical protein